MTLHLKSRGYPFRPRLLFSSFIVVGVGFPNCVLFQERTICFFRSFISFFRTFISALRGEFSFAPWRFPISSGEIGISGDVRVSECGYSAVL